MNEVGLTKSDQNLSDLVHCDDQSTSNYILRLSTKNDVSDIIQFKEVKGKTRIHVENTGIYN